MNDLYFASLLIGGGVCLGFALHAAALAWYTRQARYYQLLLLALLQVAYCLCAYRYLREADSALALPWGQSICTFTPFITYVFGQLTIELTGNAPRWLRVGQRVNLGLSTLVAMSVVLDMLFDTAIILLPELSTDLASAHRHRLNFTVTGQIYLTWVSLAFMSFSFLLFKSCRKRPELLVMMFGCCVYFVATIEDFLILVGARDAVFVQHFGFLALVVSSWRVLAKRFELTVDELAQAVKQLEEQRARLLIATPMLHQQKLDSLGMLAAGVAHEINNPIHGIMNYAELLRKRLGSEGESAQFAQEIARESQRVADIVRSLLRFGRSDEGAMMAVDVNEIIEGTLQLIRAIIDKDGIALRMNVRPGVPEIVCRAQRLQQVLMNLITNARDAINARDATRLDEKLIEVDVHCEPRQGEQWLVLEVSDTGDGFDESLRRRIFDPFFTTKPAGQGTGLGLSVSHGIVHSHGGGLSCTSKIGQGSRFRVELPCRPSESSGNLNSGTRIRRSA